jgi:hypothetical protein
MSKQDYGTPTELLTAVQKRFGNILVDLAAHGKNHVVDRWFGPQSPEYQDSLHYSCQWRNYKGLLWLNPEFEDITPWVEKSYVESNYGAFISVLTPASIGSHWFYDYVYEKSLILALNPRIKFKECEDSYPKDCIISIYGGGEIDFEVWKWK